MIDPISFDRRKMLERMEAGDAIVIGVGRTGKQVGRYYETPNIEFGAVWCKTCQKPCDFDESFAHNTANPARSRVYIRAYCHGANCDVFMTFEQWHHAPSPRIEVFDGIALPPQAEVIEEPRKLKVIKIIQPEVKTAKAEKVPLLLTWRE